MVERLRLTAATLAEMAGSTRVDGAPVEVPRYPRRHPEHRICHLGVGGFHRAHQAHYLHRPLQEGLADGSGLCGIGLRAADAA